MPDASRPPTAVQRVLLIENQMLTTEAAAKDYLRAKFTNGGKKPTAKQTSRLDELAARGVLKNEVTATTLADALEYIEFGTALNLPNQYFDASVSPEQRPRPLHPSYVMRGSVKPLMAPQSPATTFPAMAHKKLSVNIGDRLAAEQQHIHSQKGNLPKYRFGKNVFSYSTHAHIRTAPVVAKSAGGHAFLEIGGPAVFSSVSAQSRLYQSKLVLPPIGPKAKPVRVEASIRDTLQGIHTATKHHPTLKKTSLVAGKVDRSGDYFAKAGVNAFSSLYVHSEVQAAADAADGTAQLLAKAVVNAIASHAQASYTTPVEVVVVAVTIIGYSEPNTVCGGACKGALYEIRGLFGREFDAARHAAKNYLKSKGIFLRRSAEYTLEFHVCGSKKFQGYGSGASVDTTGGATLGAHGVVEYEPR